MLLLRRSSIFGTVLLAAVLSLSCAVTQEEAKSSPSPHTIEDVSTVDASSVDGDEGNGIEDSGGRLVVIPFTLSVNGQRGVPRTMWSSSPLLRALTPGRTEDQGSPVVEESLAWPSTTAALYRGLMERAARARAVEGEGEAAVDGAWSPDGLWPDPRDSGADDGYYDDQGDDETSAEEDEPGVTDYDAADDPADESMQTAETIIFRPMFRYKAQQAAKRRSYRSKPSRRRYRPRRRHYSKRKYRPYYHYNYYYPYNYYGQYSS